MKYYQARERDDGRWEFTVRHDQRIRPAGPCVSHDDGHATSEEADRHFYEHMLDVARDVSSPDDEQHRCAMPECGTWTQRGFRGRFLFPETWLCERHRTKDALREIHPFARGIQIMASY